MAHVWKDGTCKACGTNKKHVRTVSMRLPAFVDLCGPCARAAEAMPFEERTLATLKARA